MRLPQFSVRKGKMDASNEPNNVEKPTASSETYMELLQKESRIRYKQKLELVGLEQCPYEIEMDKWKSDPTQWPEHTYPHLYHYLIKSPRIYSQEAMEKYKSLDAWKFYISGWVQEVKHMKINEVTLMTAEIRPSYKTSEKTRSAWVLMKNNGSVVYGHCKCMAGLDETCSHVGAILYKMEAAVRIGFTKVTPTDLPQLWNQNFTKNIDGDKVANILIYSEKAKDKLKMPQQPTPIKPIHLDHFEEFLVNLKGTAPETVALSLFGEHQDNFVIENTQETRPHLPPSLRLLFKEKNIELNEEEYLDLAMSTMNNLKSVSLESILYVEESTRNQALSFTWFQQRAGRITGSTIRKVFKASIEEPNKELVKSICSDTAKRIKSDPLDWGRNHEDVALSLYTEVHGNPTFVPGDCEPVADCFFHYDLDVKSLGLSIYQLIPWFAASPDSVVYCSCCGYGVVEVKCPYKIAKEKLSLREEILGDRFYIKHSDYNGYYLDEDHQYYYQVQLEMLATSTTFCDFFVWTPTEFLTVRIYIDREFLGKVLQQCDIFWQHVILKELLTRRFESEVICDDIPEDGEKCSVCSDDNNYMMKCKTCLRFFHPKCAGRKTMAKPGTWNCKQCRKNKK
ncbi:uncharacterized protein [Clytia hemisphaerica]